MKITTGWLVADLTDIQWKSIRSHYQEVENPDTDKSLFDESIVRALVDIYRIITEGQTFDRGNQMFLFVTCLSQRVDKGTRELAGLQNSARCEHLLVLAVTPQCKGEIWLGAKILARTLQHHNLRAATFKLVAYHV